MPAPRAGPPLRQPPRLRLARVGLFQFAGLKQHGPEQPEQVGPLLPRVLRPERERRPVVPGGRGEGVQREGAIPGALQRGPRPGRQSRRVLARGAGQFQRAQVMVGEHLGVILGPAQRLDPAGGVGVLVGAGSTRDLPIGDVAQQHVHERVLRFASDRRGPLAADELLALQPVQILFQLTNGLSRAAECGDRPGPEDLPDHGGVLQQPLLRAVPADPAVRR